MKCETDVIALCIPELLSVKLQKTWQLDLNWNRYTTRAALAFCVGEERLKPAMAGSC
jgi:hypothetical protein